MFSKDGGTTSDHIYILIKYLLLHEKYVAMSNNKNTSVTITEQDELNKMLVYTAVTYDRIRYVIQLTPHFQLTPYFQ